MLSQCDWCFWLLCFLPLTVLSHWFPFDLWHCFVILWLFFMLPGFYHLPSCSLLQSCEIHRLFSVCVLLHWSSLTANLCPQSIWVWETSFMVWWLQQNFFFLVLILFWKLIFSVISFYLFLFGRLISQHVKKKKINRKNNFFLLFELKHPNVFLLYFSFH